MNVLVIGVDGMLGSDVFAALRADESFQIFTFNRQEFDITDFDTVRDRMPQVEVVVNCAGERQVDLAEREKEEMFAVNMKGVRNLAVVCKRNKQKLIHFSTHYVFDGQKGKGYTERDTPHPLNVYGASKLAGDQELRAAGGDYLIIRTQTLFGRHGDCAVNHLIGRFRAGEGPVRAAQDEIVVPTWTADAAQAMLRLIRSRKSGLVNYSASGFWSQADLARAVGARVNPAVPVEAVACAELGHAARRPLYGVLDNHWYQTWTMDTPGDWRDRLNLYLDEVLAEGEGAGDRTATP